MKKQHSLFITCFIAFFTQFHAYSQTKKECLSRQLVIDGAQLANQSYTFSKLAFFVPNQNLAAKNIDSALIFIQQAISSIDSAIILATDSELMALDYANIAKRFAIRAYKLLKANQQATNPNQKRDFAKQATFFAANATTDAYHASFYFKNCKPAEDK